MELRVYRALFVPFCLLTIGIASGCGSDEISDERFDTPEEIEADLENQKEMTP